MSRSAAPDAALRPIRTCVGCRRPFPKPRLVRFVLTGDHIDVDRLAQRPGRGCYVCEDRECVDTALAKGGARLRQALRRREVRANLDEDAVRSAWRQAVSAIHGEAK